MKEYKKVDLNLSITIPSYSTLTRSIVKSLFFSGRVLKVEGGGGLCVFYSHIKSRRQDYDEIITNLRCNIGIGSHCYVEYGRVFSFFGIFNFIGKTFGASKFMANSSYSFLDYINRRVLITRSMCDVDTLKEFLNSNNFKQVITFSDGHEIDNICAQISNSLHSKTFTLQHGLYNCLKKDLPENAVLKNIVSDYFFSWGPISTLEVAAYSKTKILTLGSLKSLNKDIVRYGEGLKHFKTDSVIEVMLNADNDKSSNQDMLECVSDYCREVGARFKVKYHPKNDRDLYSKFLNNSAYLLESSGKYNVNYYVAYSSGVIFELLCKGQIFFIFKNDELPDMFNIPNITFSKSSELKALSREVRLKNFRHIQENFVAKGDSSNNYKEYFKQLIKENSDV